MKKNFPKGVWPVMLTPFKKNGDVDYEHIRDLVDWYINKGVNGLFAVCQSSEMFYLSIEERVKSARAVVEAAAGRIPVIASGHISDKMEDQISEVKAMMETGIDAVILITNRFANEEESDDVWLAHLNEMLGAIDPDFPLGLYECPYPYKRLISDRNLAACAASGRFYFLKDTCCDIEILKKRIEIVRGTKLSVYNACCALVLDSLKLGAGGFCGVMANIHPELYTYLFKHYNDENAKYLQSYLTIAALIERQYYPTNAKYYLKQFEHLPIEITSRVQDEDQFQATQMKEVKDLYLMNQKVKEVLFT